MPEDDKEGEINRIYRDLYAWVMEKKAETALGKMSVIPSLPLVKHETSGTRWFDIADGIKAALRKAIPTQSIPVIRDETGIRHLYRLENDENKGQRFDDAAKHVRIRSRLGVIKYKNGDSLRHNRLRCEGLIRDGATLLYEKDLAFRSKTAERPYLTTELTEAKGDDHGHQHKALINHAAGRPPAPTQRSDGTVTTDLESKDGSFRITRWYPDAQPEFQITPASRPRQRWVDARDHARRVRGFPKGVQNDPLAYVVDLEIDHKEGPGSRAFQMKLAEGTYAQQMATIECLKGDSKARQAVRSALHGGEFEKFARSSPPASLAAMIAITTPDGRFLAVQRSRTVQYERLHWMVGITELMKPYSKLPQPDHDQGIPAVVIRALKEELTLGKDDVTTPLISWIGYWAPSACVNFIAHVQLKIRPEEMEGRKKAAEIERYEWLPLDETTVEQIMARSRRGRKWTPHGRLMIQEVLRFRRCLEDNPYKHLED